MITQIAGAQPVADLLLRFPELLIMQIGCIVFISECLNWRLLAWLNPKVEERKVSTRDRKRKSAGRKRGSSSKKATRLRSFGKTGKRSTATSRQLEQIG